MAPSVFALHNPKNTPGCSNDDEAQRFVFAVESGNDSLIVEMLRLAENTDESERQIEILFSERQRLERTVESGNKSEMTKCRLVAICVSVLLAVLVAAIFHSPVLAFVAIPCYWLFSKKSFAECERHKMIRLKYLNWKCVCRLVDVVADERGYKHAFSPLFLEQGLSAWNRYRDFCGQLNRKREEDRWAEIERAVPPLPQSPSPPRFIDAVIVLGQKDKRRYAKWLMDFDRWIDSRGRNSYVRSEQGKSWSWGDWKWHRLFDEWQAKTLIPELFRINHSLRERFDKHKEEMRREYQRRFSRLPSDDEIPIRPLPTVEGENIPDCYGCGHRIIRHDRLQAYIAAVVPPMPKLNNAESETLRCIASYARGLDGVGSLNRLVRFVSNFQYHCADRRIPDYGWACIGETGLREVFAAGEIFCCHQQGLLNTNIAVASRHYAVIAITTLERDIWRYVEELCFQKPMLDVALMQPSFELS